MRQTVELGTEDLMAQVLLLEGLHHVTRPKVALPLCLDLLSSLDALSFSNKEHEFNDEGQEGVIDAAKHGLRLRLVLTFSKTVWGGSTLVGDFETYIYQSFACKIDLLLA